MKKTMLLLLGSYIGFTGIAQQKEGKVLYERTMQMQIVLNDDGQGEQELTKTRTDKFELLFANNQCLWHAVDEQLPADEMEGGGNVQIRMIGMGADDVSFYDLGTGTSREQREMFDKKFVVADSIRKMNWKIAGELKTILNHSCQKATAQRIGKRVMMNMDNGTMQRKEISDTSLVTAWFTSDIPVPTGPSEYQGQLPGLILELDINNGRQIFKAVEIAPKPDIAIIKEPKSGKKVTADEFRKETQKMMDEMQKNNQGSRKVMRFNN